MRNCSAGEGEIQLSKINIAGIIKESVVDGPGFRLVIFTQGCPRHCSGCHNPDLIPPSGGREMTPEELLESINNNITPLTRGITFSGGDPLMQMEAMAALLKLVREKWPGFDIWVYTGYTFEEIRNWPGLQYIDVLVDGPFVESLRDINLAFRGSSNQRLIDVQSSLEDGEVVYLSFN